MKITPIKISLLILLASLFLSNCDSGTGPDPNYKDMKVTFKRLSYVFNEYSGRISGIYNLSFEDKSPKERERLLREYNQYANIDVFSEAYQDSLTFKFSDIPSSPLIKGGFVDGRNRIIARYQGQFQEVRYFDTTTSIFESLQSVMITTDLYKAHLFVTFGGLRFQSEDSLSMNLLKNPHLIDDFFPRELTLFHNRVGSRRY